MTPFKAIWIIILPLMIMSQETSVVEKVTVTTADDLIFTTWLDRYETDEKQSIKLEFKIENRSRQAIYLVRSDTPEIVRDEYSLTIGPHVPYADGHGRTDYNFTRIPRYSSYSGQLEIPWSLYPIQRQFEIKTVFVYTYSIEGLKVPPPSGNPLELLWPLSERVRVVSVGNLTMKVNFAAK